MQSTANFRGHPIHPMLIPFPFALLTSAVVADVGGLLSRAEDLWVVAWYLLPAGIGMALVAAVPGFIDYRHTVPPRSSGKKRATKHMITNLSAVALFAVAWVLRGGPGLPPDALLIVMELAAGGLLSVGGWIGGTLSFRNQIGVNHRYANAGKWKETRIAPSGEWVRVASSDELKSQQMKLLHVGDKRIVLGRASTGWVAFDDHCPHRGGSLAGGVMACDTVTCPWHGSQFDVKTGGLASGPAEEGIRTYEVEVRGTDVMLRT